MSAVGTLLDALVTHAATAGIANATRGVVERGGINTEDYPHFFAYNPRTTAAPLAFLQQDVRHLFPVKILTKGETQEQVLTRVEAFKAQIEGDRTLGGLVDSADVTASDVFEDPRTGIKFADLIVSTEALE